MFQINKLPPKDLTVVPEEAKMSSTCLNEQIEFLRIESVQENQLAALNFAADPQHRRLSSLNLLERKTSDSPDKKFMRATTTNFRDPVYNLDDGETTPSFANFRRVNRVDVIDELLEELDPCEKKEEQSVPQTEDKKLKITIKPIPAEKRRSSGGSKARSTSAERYLRLRRSVAPDSLSEPGQSRDISETRLSENWTDLAPFLSHSA